MGDTGNMMGNAGNMMGDTGSMMWGGLVWGVLVLLLLAVVAASTAYLVIQARHSPGSQPGLSAAPPASRGTSAVDILRSRYAAGEFDEDEYSRRKAFIERY